MIRTNTHSSFTEGLCKYKEDFYRQAAQDEPATQILKTSLVGRVISVGISFLLHAEAVCKAVIVCFLSIQEIFSQTDEELLKTHKVECKEAYAKSWESFLSIFSAHVSPPHVEAPTHEHLEPQPERPAPQAVNAPVQPAREPSQIRTYQRPPATPLGLLDDTPVDFDVEQIPFTPFLQARQVATQPVQIPVYQRPAATHLPLLDETEVDFDVEQIPFTPFFQARQVAAQPVQIPIYQRPAATYLPLLDETEVDFDVEQIPFTPFLQARQIATQPVQIPVYQRPAATHLPLLDEREFDFDIVPSYIIPFREQPLEDEPWYPSSSSSSGWSSDNDESDDGYPELDSALSAPMTRKELLTKFTPEVIGKMLHENGFSSPRTSASGIGVPFVSRSDPSFPLQIGSPPVWEFGKGHLGGYPFARALFSDGKYFPVPIAHDTILGNCPLQIVGMVDPHTRENQTATFLGKNLVTHFKNEFEAFCETERTDTNIWNSIYSTFRQLEASLPDHNRNLMGSSGSIVFIIEDTLWVAQYGNTSILVETPTGVVDIDFHTNARFGRTGQKLPPQIGRFPLNIFDAGTKLIIGTRAVFRTSGQNLKDLMNKNPNNKLVDQVGDTVYSLSRQIEEPMGIQKIGLDIASEWGLI